MNTKLSQFPPAPSGPAAGDQFVGVRNGNTDILFSEAQMQSAFGTGGGGGGGGSLPGEASALTPPVTAGSPYGPNVVIGGVLHFTGVFAAGVGSGVVNGVRVTCAAIEYVTWTLYLLNAAPLSAFADNQVANINAGDVAKVLMAITLSPANGLGTHSIFQSAVNTEVVTGGTDLWGVLVSNDVLTNPFPSTGAVLVELTVTPDA